MRGFGGPDGEDTVENSSAHAGDNSGAKNPGAIHGASLRDVSKWVNQQIVF